MRPNYVYRVVTSNGHGVHSREFKRCAEAKATARRRAEAEAESRVNLGPFEIERVQLLGGGGRRYWLRKHSRWVLLGREVRHRREAARLAVARGRGGGEPRWLIPTAGSMRK